MTEQIDLDDLDTGDEQAEEEDAPNRGDWFWKGEGDPDEEPGAPSWGEENPGADEGAAGATPDAADSTTDGAAETAAGADADADADAGDAAAAETGEDTSNRTPASPHVPSDTAGTPAGIPVRRGGGGAGEASSAGAADDASGVEAESAESAESAETRASGPHGGGTDDMTTAFTYRAAKRLANPAAAFAEAEQWSDWLGIVGDVEAHVLGSFQRNETIDADFFNGSGTGPAERLDGIGPHSMFFADRMVVVGVPGEDEAIAEEAGWEFVPLEDAAAGAGWELVDEADAEGEESGDADGDADDAESGTGAGDIDGDADADDADR